MSGTASSPIVPGSDSPPLVRFRPSPSPIKIVNHKEQYRLVLVLKAIGYISITICAHPIRCEQLCSSV